MANVHITRISDTLANALTDLDDGQTILLSDQDNEHMHRIGSDYYFPAISKDWNGAAYTYHDAYFNDIYAYSDLFVADYLYHYGDTDTKLTFDTDRMKITVGGVEFVDIVEGASDYIEFNSAEADVDYIFNTTTAYTLYLEGSTGYVSIGLDIDSYTPSALLHVHIGGALTSISASADVAAIFSNNTGGTYIDLYSDAATQTIGIRFGHSGDEDAGVFSFDLNDDRFYWYIGGTCRANFNTTGLRIQPDGIDDTSPTVLQLVDTAEQLRINYNGTYYSSFFVDNSGYLNISPYGYVLRLKYDATYYTSFKVNGSGGLEIIPVSGNIGINITAPAGVLDIVKDTGVDTDDGINVMVGNKTATSGAFTEDTTNRNVMLANTGTLTDDGVMTLIDRVASNETIVGFGFVAIGLTGQTTEWAFFSFDDTGVTLISNSTNVANSDSDTNLCVYKSDVQNLIAKNRLGATYEISYWVFYGSVFRSEE